MSSLVQMFRSSLGRKYLMSLTGLGLAVFTLVHMAGNLILFIPDGGVSYNLYSYKLTSNKALLYGAEAGLVVLFLIHIANAMALNMKNFGARETSYAQGTHGEKGVTLASKTMPYTGFLLAAFVVLHLAHFKYAEYSKLSPHAETTVGEVAMRDMYASVAHAFSAPTSPWLWIYLGCMVILLIHLIHGVQSAAQSLGLAGRPTRCLFECAGKGLAVIIAVGFMLPPIYLAFFQ